MFNLNKLSPVQFEEFCYDLLKTLDFQNLSWRKGTGLKGSPSDQGRDIQGDKLVSDIDGHSHFEHWYIECKHYKKGVPPDKIHSALAWANAKRPNVLLLIASNFFSNQTKNYIEEFEKNDSPAFRIKMWELKDLENLTADLPLLREKYGLSTETSCLKYTNKYHIIYSLTPQINTVKFFLETMNELDPEKRDLAFDATYLNLVQPRFREALHDQETLGNCQIDRCDYQTFKEKCNYIENLNNPQFVQMVVSNALANSFNRADKSKKKERVDFSKWMIEKIQRDLETEKDERKRVPLLKIIDREKKFISEIDQRLKNAEDVYYYICQNLVRILLSEKPISKFYSL